MLNGNWQPKVCTRKGLVTWRQSCSRHQRGPMHYTVNYNHFKAAPWKAQELFSVIWIMKIKLQPGMQEQDYVFWAVHLFLLFFLSFQRQTCFVPAVHESFFRITKFSPTHSRKTLLYCIVFRVFSRMILYCNLTMNFVFLKRTLKTIPSRGGLALIYFETLSGRKIPYACFHLLFW